jgi:hypothetical protein
LSLPKLRLASAVRGTGTSMPQVWPHGADVFAGPTRARLGEFSGFRLPMFVKNSKLLGGRKPDSVGDGSRGLVQSKQRGEIAQKANPRSDGGVLACAQRVVGGRRLFVTFASGEAPFVAKRTRNPRIGGDRGLFGRTPRRY